MIIKLNWSLIGEERFIIFFNQDYFVVDLLSSGTTYGLIRELIWEKISIYASMTYIGQGLMNVGFNLLVRF